MNHKKLIRRSRSRIRMTSFFITKEDVQHLRELYSNPVKINVPDVYTHR